ncbi:MAG: GNAT family N-acetyltransferase [Oscillospiraceae bacterium]|nr:GNAT family N-acetyltransferase [Oscillospiraceae bacterium]
MEIRFVQLSEVAQLARNVVSAFPSKTPDALLRNMPNELVHPDEGRYLGCFDDDGTLLGSVLFMDFDLNVRGKMIPMGAPAYVSTHFLHKKEKVARTLLRVLMGYYASLGVPISCLHPFNPAFYNKMGYGYASELLLFQPKPCYIRSWGEKSGLSYAETEEDRKEVLAYYQRWAERTHGATVHHFMDPHRIFDMPYVVTCRRDGRLTGYLTFEFVEVDHYTDMYHDLAVREMLYDDVETLRTFMTFFASQTDQIERVRIYTHDPSLQLMFSNPDSGENRLHTGCIHETCRCALDYMARIIDIPGYFKLEDHCEGTVSRDFVLELQVRDSFLPANNGSFYLKVSGDHLTVCDRAPADVTLYTDIADLSSLVMGATPLKDFLAYGQMSISDKSFADDVQKAIGWSEKPKNYTYF